MFQTNVLGKVNHGVPVSIKEISETNEYYWSSIQITPYQKQGHVTWLVRESHKTAILNDTLKKDESEAE
jgi:phosphoribosylaminoimidazole carboxylase (NCAIR synthetase)